MKKILLIGDSIRQGYDYYVKEAFKGVANVRYPSTNCMFTTVILRYLAEWAENLECKADVDLIHWNAGLWDDLIMLDYRRLVPPEIYKENVYRICVIIEKLFPNAKMIFATSTPMNGDLIKRDCKRTNQDTQLYNRIACGVIERCGGGITDLYSVLEKAPVSFHSDVTHYYTKEGTQLITETVVSGIEKALDIKAHKLDYDRYFKSPNQIVGF